MKSLNNIKISFILPSFKYGGAEKNLINLANYFHKKNYKVDILVINNHGFMNELLLPKINIINFNKSKSSYAFFKLLIYFFKNQPSYHFSSIRNLNVLSIICSILSFKKIKIIIRESNVVSRFDSNLKSFSYKVFSFLAKYLYPLSFKIIAVSFAVQKSLINELNIKKNLIFTIYNPIDLNEILNKSQKPVFHKFIENKNKIILSIGSLTKQKNHQLLLRSFSQVLKKKNAYLIIIGEGEQKDKLIKICKTLNISNFVDFYGTTNNPYFFLKNCDLFVLPSLWEGFPNVLLEAISCKSKIIATNCEGGSFEILNNYKYATLIKNNDLNILTNSILKILEDNFDKKDSYYNLDEFSLENQFGKYEQILK